MTYNEFIQNILDTRGRFVENYDGVKERHHIKMRSLGGKNDEDNLIDLIGSEHYEAHKLLALENPDCKEAQYAWWMMCRTNGVNGRVCEISAEEWIEFKKRWHEMYTGENHPMFGKHQTEEAKKRISDGLKGVMAGEKNPMYGKTMSDETKAKLSASLIGKQAGEKHWAYGKHLSEETKRKISKSGTGRKVTEETRQNISRALMGHIVTDETRAKMSVAKKGKYVRENNPLFGKHLPDEVKQKLSESHKGLQAGGKNVKAKKCVCDNVIYDCVTDCANVYDVKPGTMMEWLRKDKIPTKFKELGLTYYKE